MIIECIDCENRTRAKCRSKKRCKLCAIKAIRKDSQKYKRSLKGRRTKKTGDRRYKASPRGHRIHKAWNMKFYRTLKGYIKGRERSWHANGVVLRDGSPLTWERFQQDAKSGCKLKFLGNCSGELGADHDHETGFYRGPLCDNHNRGLGRFGDTPKSLRLVAKILEECT